MTGGVDSRDISYLRGEPPDTRVKIFVCCSTPMKPTDFAHYLSARIWPSAIAEAAKELHENPGSSAEPAKVFILSAVLESGYDAGFDCLANLYLQNFSIPNELLNIARLYQIPSAALDAVGKARFTGETIFAAQGSAPQGSGMAILEVRSTVLELTLLKAPLEALAELVAHLAIFWKQLAQTEGPKAVHHEHSAESPFLAWVDIQVARYYGFELIGRAGMTSDVFKIEYIDRFCNCHGPLPIDIEMLQNLRITAPLVWRERHPLSELYSKLYS
jgi:hypothetical protein